MYLVHYRAIAAAALPCFRAAGCETLFSSRVQYVLSKYKRADVFAAGVLRGIERGGGKKAKVLHSTAGSNNGRIGNYRSNIVAECRHVRPHVTEFTTKNGEKMPIFFKKEKGAKVQASSKTVNVPEKVFFVKLVSFFSLPSNWSTERPGKSF